MEVNNSMQSDISTFLSRILLPIIKLSAYCVINSSINITVKTSHKIKMASTLKRFGLCHRHFNSLDRYIEKYRVGPFPISNLIKLCNSFSRCVI